MCYTRKQNVRSKTLSNHMSIIQFLDSPLRNIFGDHKFKLSFVCMNKTVLKVLNTRRLKCFTRPQLRSFSILRKAKRVLVKKLCIFVFIIFNFYVCARDFVSKSFLITLYDIYGSKFDIVSSLQIIFFFNFLYIS